MYELPHRHSVTRWLMRLNDTNNGINLVEKKTETDQDLVDIAESVLEIGQTIKRMIKEVVASKLSNN